MQPQIAYPFFIQPTIYTTYNCKIPKIQPQPHHFLSKILVRATPIFLNFHPVYARRFLKFNTNRPETLVVTGTNPIPDTEQNKNTVPNTDTDQVQSRVTNKARKGGSKSRQNCQIFPVQKEIS